MAFLEGKTPAERRNIIILIVLGSIVLLGVVYNFVLSDSTSKRKSGTRSTVRTATTPTSETVTPQEVRANQPPRRIIYQPIVLTPEPQVGRNIFAYYTALVRSGSGAGGAIATTNLPITVETPPTPTPVPPPPVILAGVSPSNIMGRSSDFTLEVAGDKFTPETRIYFNGGELPTTFENPQRMRARVPSALISSAGGRSVIVRTPDGSLFSNPLNFTVLPPPTPQFTYVGLIGRQRNRDTAVLLNGKKELLSYQRNDVIDGRFRLTNISEQSVELTDTELGIKHTLPFVEGRNAAGSLNARPQRPISPPPVDGDTLNDDDNQPF